MLAGLNSLGACNALTALRERAAECGWTELFGHPSELAAHHPRG